MDLQRLQIIITCLLMCWCGVAMGAALPRGRRDVEAAQNEVWPPPTPAGRLSLRSLIQALYRLNTLGLPRQLEEDLDQGEVTDTDDYPWQSPEAPHLVEHIPDVLPLPIEVDKSHKFTHSFRFGYGAPV